MRGPNLLASVVCSTFALACYVGGAPALLSAQIPAVNPAFWHNSGQNVAPVYEGWYKGADNTIRVSFGYFNRNLQETPEVPIGPSNRIQPGNPDQGQPTHFLVGRHHSVFTVTVPADSPNAEVTWTLAVNGQTLSIPANLDPLYMLGGAEGDQMFATEADSPPVMKFERTGRGVSGPDSAAATVSASLAKPTPLEVWVDFPEPPPLQAPVSTLTGRRADAGGGKSEKTVRWSKYRGPGAVTFANARPTVQQGKATTTATFSEPGDYVLLVRAGEEHPTSGFVTIKWR